MGQSQQEVDKGITQTQSSENQVLRLTLFLPSSKPLPGLPLHDWASFVHSVHKQTGLFPKDVSVTT